MTTKPFQRLGSTSNSGVGSDFEALARDYFLREEGLKLVPNFPIELRAHQTAKARRFDFGSESPAVLIECKSHRWTETGNIPSAKVTVWNESMYYFHLAPSHYRRILFVLRDLNKKKNETLAQYYCRIYGHLIPRGVQILEFDEHLKTGLIVWGGDQAVGRG